MKMDFMKSNWTKWAIITVIAIGALVTLGVVFGGQQRVAWTPAPVDELQGWGEPVGFNVYQSISSDPIVPGDPATYNRVTDAPYLGQIQHELLVIGCNRQIYFAVTAYNTAGETGVSDTGTADSYFEECLPQPPIQVLVEAVSAFVSTVG